MSETTSTPLRKEREKLALFLRCCGCGGSITEASSVPCPRQCIQRWCGKDCMSDDRRVHRHVRICRKVSFPDVLAFIRGHRPHTDGSKVKPILWRSPFDPADPRRWHVYAKPSKIHGIGLFNGASAADAGSMLFWEDPLFSAFSRQPLVDHKNARSIMEIMWTTLFIQETVFNIPSDCPTGCSPEFSAPRTPKGFFRNWDPKMIARSLLVLFFGKGYMLHPDLPLWSRYLSFLGDSEVDGLDDPIIPDAARTALERTYRFVSLYLFRQSDEVPDDSPVIGLPLIHSMINFSCEPNAVVRCIRGRYFLIALRSIDANEEITIAPHGANINDPRWVVQGWRKKVLASSAGVRKCRCSCCQDQRVPRRNRWFELPDLDHAQQLLSKNPLFGQIDMTVSIPMLSPEQREESERQLWSERIEDMIDTLRSKYLVLCVRLGFESVRKAIDVVLRLVENRCDAGQNLLNRFSKPPRIVGLHCAILTLLRFARERLDAIEKQNRSSQPEPDAWMLSPRVVEVSSLFKRQILQLPGVPGDIDFVEVVDFWATRCQITPILIKTINRIELRNSLL